MYADIGTMKYTSYTNNSRPKPTAIIFSTAPLSKMDHWAMRPGFLITLKHKTSAVCNPMTFHTSCMMIHQANFLVA